MKQLQDQFVLGLLCGAFRTEPSYWTRHMSQTYVAIMKFVHDYNARSKHDRFNHVSAFSDEVSRVFGVDMTFGRLSVKAEKFVVSLWQAYTDSLTPEVAFAEPEQVKTKTKNGF